MSVSGKYNENCAAIFLPLLAVCEVSQLSLSPVWFVYRPSSWGGHFDCSPIIVTKQRLQEKIVWFLLVLFTECQHFLVIRYREYDHEWWKYDRSIMLCEGSFQLYYDWKLLLISISLLVVLCYTAWMLHYSSYLKCQSKFHG